MHQDGVAHWATAAVVPFFPLGLNMGRNSKSRAHKPWRQQRAEERAARIAAKQQAREARAEQGAARRARVAALNDARATPAEIAAELGLNVGSVRNILARIGKPRQDKERAAQVRRKAIELRECGMTWRAIGEAIGAPTTTVYVAVNGRERRKAALTNTPCGSARSAARLPSIKLGGV